MRPSRLFADKAALNRALLAPCCVAGVLCLLSGVVLTVTTLEHALLLGACLGVALVIGGAFLIEMARWTEEKDGNRSIQRAAARAESGCKNVEVPIEPAVLQALVILLFGLFLDNGVRQCACFYSCLPYWAGALLVFVRRRSSLTRGDRLYLRWGWLPILVIGTVLFLREWKQKGLI